MSFHFALRGNGGWERTIKLLSPEGFVVTEHQKLLLRILRGTSDANIPFDGVRSLLRSLGFAERVRGSHHIFTKEGVMEILNLQPKAGGKAKPYQVKQVRQVILDYRLGGEEDNG